MLSSGHISRRPELKVSSWGVEEVIVNSKANFGRQILCEAKRLLLRCLRGRFGVNTSLGHVRRVSPSQTHKFSSKLPLPIQDAVLVVRLHLLLRACLPRHSECSRVRVGSNYSECAKGVSDHKHYQQILQNWRNEFIGFQQDFKVLAGHSTDFAEHCEDKDEKVPSLCVKTKGNESLIS